ncbi:MAG: hypothetical protein NC429_08655 [Lachnospiraceae bacterium]|nr:hypothetical protein [Lachnospiraceae bacterium]
MDGFMPGEECRKCQGRCCRERGCSLSPQDMENALLREGFLNLQPADKKFKEAVLCLLQKTEGKELYAIDRFAASRGPVFYLRMRHKCHTFIGVDAMGECAALTPEGCSLGTEQRPKGGRFLKSAPDGRCTQQYTQEMMESDWKPYQEILREIWQEYEPLFQEDGTFDRCEEAWFAYMRAERERSL